MSVFSVTAVDRLIEPAGPSISSPMEGHGLSTTDRKPPFSFYPPLYVTPPPQRPPSPSSFSPSPYVLNFKRRCPVQNGVLDARGIDTNDSQQLSSSFDKQGPTGIASELENSEQCTFKKVSNDEKGDSISAGMEDLGAEASGQPGENEVFEIEIVPSSCNGRNFRSEVSAHADTSERTIGQKDVLLGKKASNSPKYQSLGAGWEGNHLALSVASLASEEFFDAPDFPLYDSASEEEVACANSNATGSPIKSDENIIERLQEEIARRIRAEKALASLELQWEKMARRCSFIGISLSSGLCQDGLMDSGQGEGEVDPFELFTEKLMVARLVGGAIASGAIRAVKEEELENTVTAKNREISRLRDKLQYYELVNHEMSQRNQEAIEVAQRRKRRRHRRQKWAFGLFGAACCIGTAGLLCYKFFPWEQAQTWTKPSNGVPRMEPSSMEPGST